MKRRKLTKEWGFKIKTIPRWHDYQIEALHIKRVFRNKVSTPVNSV